MVSTLLRNLECELNNRSGEYLEETTVAKKILLTLPVMTSMDYLVINKVDMVHNNYLRLLYQLKKEEYEIRYGSVTEKLLYHATSESKVQSIISSNLDWRRVSRNLFGTGVSFSDDPDYANFQSNPGNGSKRAFIVANVLVSRETKGSRTMKIPPEGFDTAVGNNRVYVKFYDNEFLPLYVIYYDAPDETRSKYYTIRHRRRVWF